MHVNATGSFINNLNKPASPLVTCTFIVSKSCQAYLHFFGDLSQQVSRLRSVANLILKLRYTEQHIVCLFYVELPPHRAAKFSSYRTVQSLFPLAYLTAIFKYYGAHLCILHHLLCLMNIVFTCYLRSSSSLFEASSS